MRDLAALAGIRLNAATLVDGFNTIVLPRRVRRIFPLARIFYRITWSPYARLASRTESGSRREEYLSVYGPLSLLLLLVCWVIALILGFGLLQHSAWLKLDGKLAGFADAVYVSASSLLMIASEHPGNTASRWLMTVEAGVGFGLLGLVIGYLPVLYQSYSSRELRIALLDARAGSPPCAGELLAREARNVDMLARQLRDWEEWIAEVLEEQLSYSMLAYFRSQHQNQSWLAALTAMLDSSAIVLLCSDDELKRQAYLTFAIGRHALVDLATVFRLKPQPPAEDRLPASGFSELCKTLADTRTCLRVENLSEEDLSHLRSMYEPYAFSLSPHFLMALPTWLKAEGYQDNWLTATDHHPGDTLAISDPFSRHSH